MEKGTIQRLLTYYLSHPEFKDDTLRALRSFFHRPSLSAGDTIETSEEDKELFNEWLAFDFKLKNGKTLLADFCQRNPYNLTSAQLQIYQDLQDNEYGTFEILEIKTGEGFRLKDLKIGKEYWVKEYRGTFEAKAGELLIARVGKVGDHLELVGANPYSLPRDGKHPFLGRLISQPKLDPKKAKDFFEQMEKIRNANNDSLKEKILDGGRCICDLCGKRGKLAAMSHHKKTGEPMVICNKCNLKIMAEEEGISIKEAARRRKRMFEVGYLFQDLKLKEYLKFKNKKRFDSLAETNQSLNKIVEAWNDLSIKERKSFEIMADKELLEIYKNIKIDFSGL